MEGTAKREAGFPGEAFEFEVVPGPGCSDAQVQWSGGGTPPTGSGRTFKTRFATGGTFTVVARCGADAHDFTATVCPIDQWLEHARAFYGTSIDFSKVRVKASGLVFGGSGVGWTCNDVVRFKRARTIEELPEESTLIHELGHVWEHQNGQAQLMKGLVEQTGRVFGRDPYDYGGPAGVRGATGLARFKKEGQAEILRNCWLARQGMGRDISDVAFTPEYAADLERLVGGAEVGTGGLPRRTVASAVDGAMALVVNGVLAVLRA